MCYPGGGLVSWQLAGINYIIRGGEGHRRLHTQHHVKAKYCLIACQNFQYLLLWSVLTSLEVLISSIIIGGEKTSATKETLIQRQVALVVVL